MYKHRISKASRQVLFRNIPFLIPNQPVKTWKGFEVSALNNIYTNLIFNLVFTLTATIAGFQSFFS